MVLGGSLFFVMRDRFSDSSFGLLRRMANISPHDRTIQARFLAWGVAIEGWKERPMLGWGIENFNLEFNKYYDPRMFNQEPWWDRAHNFIFDIGITTGIVGLLSYLSIFVTAIFALFKKRRTELWTFIMLSSVMFVYLVNNLFTFETLTSLIPLFMVLAYVVFLSRSSSVTEISRETPKNTGSASPFFMVLIVSFLVIVPIFYYINWKPFQENRFGKAGWDVLVEGRDKEAFVLFDEALSYNTFGSVDIRRFIAEYIFIFVKRGGERDPIAMNMLYKYSTKKAEENIVARPNDVKWYMYAGELYNLRSMEEPGLAIKAEELFELSTELSPARQQNYMELAFARKTQGNTDGMWDALEKAVFVFPQNPNPHLQSAVHAIELGLHDRADREIKWLEENSWSRFYAKGEDGWHSPTGDAAHLVDAYFNAAHIDKAIEFQKKLIEEMFRLNPNNQEFLKKAPFINQYARLAALYQIAGRIDEARETALYVLELDPSRAEETAAFLQFLEK